MPWLVEIGGDEADLQVIEDVGGQFPKLENKKEKMFAVDLPRNGERMSFVEKVENFAEDYPKGKFILVLILSLIAFLFFNIYLGILYERTGYPVPLIEGQTRFNADLIRSDFSVLIENETIGDYIFIQYLDLGIIISTAVFFTMLGFFIFRRLKSPVWKRRGFILAFLFPLSSLLDLIENSFLLAMVYNPIDFAAWLAYAYSGSAVLKLLSFLIGILALISIPILSKLSGRGGVGHEMGP